MADFMRGILSEDMPAFVSGVLSGSSSTAPTGYGNRLDNTPKGSGYFGELKRPDGGFSTELSFDFDAGGQKIFAPLLVPSLSKSEIDHLLAGSRPTPEIFNKAQQFALDRLKSGMPTFAQPGETYPVPGTTDVAPLPYRNMLRNEGQNMAGAGVIMPPTGIPNAYGGQPMSPREALAPNAPELYDRRKPRTWLRRI